MKNKFLKRNVKMKSKIFIQISAYMLLVFVAIMIAFNIFLYRYIQSDVGVQLENLSNMYSDQNLSNGKKEGERLHENNMKNKFGTDAEVLVIDSSYEIIKYEGSSNLSKEELSEIIGKLREKSDGLENIQNASINTSFGKYYASSISDVKNDNSYLIFFVNVTVITDVVNTINLALLIIIAIALCISFAIANSIANSITLPIKELSIFAKRIGKGNFVPQEFSLAERELSELAYSMNESAKKLSKYDNEQRIFFQNASHELRTPLMAIKCHAEGIECGIMDSKKSSEVIISEIDRLTELVEELLYISRIDNLNESFAMKEKDLRKTLEDCANSMKAIFEKNSIKLNLKFDEEPIMYLYNEKQIYRAISNLLSNASHYAKSFITLGCEYVEDTIKITVLDDGEGISLDDLPYIFDRFYKGSNGRYGLGLSIVKLIVSLHNGSIDVSQDNGTLFTITLKK